MVLGFACREDEQDAPVTRGEALFTVARPAATLWDAFARKPRS
jgi:hypothetical protein